MSAEEGCGPCADSVVTGELCEVHGQAGRDALAPMPSVPPVSPGGVTTPTDEAVEALAGLWAHYRDDLPLPRILAREALAAVSGGTVPGYRKELEEGHVVLDGREYEVDGKPQRVCEDGSLMGVLPGPVMYLLAHLRPVGGGLGEGEPR